jgi:hypothetical protein
MYGQTWNIMLSLVYEIGTEIIPINKNLIKYKGGM